MNDDILMQLKILVERAVRPVRASIARKRKMREELLAHVTAVFAEEAKHDVEQRALETTGQRFVAPAELTRQLQATVPTGERLNGILESLIGFPPRGSMLRLALRHALFVFACTTAALLVLLPIMIVATGENDWLTSRRLPAIMAPVNLAFLVFWASLLGQSMLRAFFGPGGPSWPRVVAIGVATWLLVPVWLFVLCFAITGSFLATLLDLLPLLLSSFLAPVLLAIVVKACIGEIRYCEEWASLKRD